MKRIFFGLVLVMGLFGCKETETDKVADAQFCIDQATAASVGECVAKIEGIETRAAYVIRCTAKFVEQSYTEGDRIFTALQALDNNTSDNQSPAMMGLLAFTAAGTSSQTQWDTNLANAQLAVSHCQRADLKALINIASYAAIATAVGPFLGVGDSITDPDDLQAALGAASTNPAAQAVIGNAALASYNENCATEGGDAPGDFCAQFEAAVAANGSDPEDVGQFIAQCYSNPAAVGCEAFR